MGKLVVGGESMDMDFIEVNKYIDELRSAGSTWQDIADLCNSKYGKNYGESKWRKPYQAWRITVDDVLQDESNELIEQEMKRLARAQMRLEANRKILNAKRAVVNEEVNKVALYELFNERAIAAFKSCNVKLSKLNVKVESKRNYVFINTDSHFDGHQNLNIEFSEKLAYVRELKQQYGFKEIIWAELGDLIDGATLRPSQLQSIKVGMVDQATTVSKYYIEFINMLSKDEKDGGLGLNVIFPIVESSNHTQLRNFGSGRSELPLEDFMRVIADNIKLGTALNKRVTVISAPRIMTNINGIDYLFEHGHEMPKKSNHVQNVESFYNARFDYAYFGHFHGFKSEDLVYMENKGFNKNATFCGHSNCMDDDFAQRLLLSSAPSIHFSIDTDHGKELQRNLILSKSLEYYKNLPKDEKILIL